MINLFILGDKFNWHRLIRPHITNKLRRYLRSLQWPVRIPSMTFIPYELLDFTVAKVEYPSCLLPTIRMLLVQLCTFPCSIVRFLSPLLHKGTDLNLCLPCVSEGFYGCMDIPEDSNLPLLCCYLNYVEEENFFLFLCFL